MYDYGARNYEPALGRWMNIDPLAEDAPDYSPFAFCFNNPVYYIDPDGMMADSNNVLSGWVNQGGQTFWDPKVNNQDDATRLHGDTANYVPDNTVTPNGDGTSTQYNPDGTKTTILKEVVVESPKPLPLSSKISRGANTAALAVIVIGLGPENPVADAVAGVVEVVGQVAAGGALLVELSETYSNPNATTVGHYDSMSKGKGERGQTRKASGTDNPFKKLKPDPNKPGNVLEKNSHTGKVVSKPAPPGYPGK